MRPSWCGWLGDTTLPAGRLKGSARTEADGWHIGRGLTPGSDPLVNSADLTRGSDPWVNCLPRGLTPAGEASLGSIVLRQRRRTRTIEAVATRASLCSIIRLASRSIAFERLTSTVDAHFTVGAGYAFARIGRNT